MADRRPTDRPARTGALAPAAPLLPRVSVRTYQPDQKAIDALLGLTPQDAAPPARRHGQEGTDADRTQ